MMCVKFLPCDLAWQCSWKAQSREVYSAGLRRFHLIVLIASIQFQVAWSATGGVLQCIIFFLFKVREAWSLKDKKDDETRAPSGRGDLM